MLGEWLAKIPEVVFRVFGLAFFVFWVGFRGFQLWSRPELRATPDDVAIWLLETGIYSLMIWGYVRRAPAFERASRWSEIVFPLIGGPLPFLLTRPDFHLVVPPRVVEGLIAAGDLIAVTAYAFLGGSFSILVDARPLKDRGPYRFVRHPVYLGQMLATLGVVLSRFTPWNAALWVAFVLVQVTRAVLEERKLARATPGYLAYRARTKMFVPFVV